MKNECSVAEPIKKIKKKFWIRTLLTIIVAIVFAVSAICIYIKLMPVSIDYGYSELYNQQDMDAAIEMINDEINSMHGCKLYSLSYSGDERCKSELDYCNSLSKDGEIFTECIVFDSCFLSPIFGGGGWNPNSLYYWSWYFARTENGSWQLLTRGYA